MIKKIAIFASGSGSNAENIYRYFLENKKIEVDLLVCNKSDAGVWDRFHDAPIRKLLISKHDLSSEKLIESLRDIDFIVLAGFLLLIPKELLAAFPNRMINIHPSLLPKYGGKGMYGIHVHRAVIQQKEMESGITIHLVNEEFDRGKILFQAKLALSEGDTPESLSSKINQLELEFFPRVIEDYILNFSD